MCQPIFALTFCAVFAPAPTPAAPAEPVAIVAVDDASKGSGQTERRVPEPGGAPDLAGALAASGSSADAKGGTRKEGEGRIVAAPAERREAPAQAALHETEDKGGGSLTQDALERTDTEAK